MENEIIYWTQNSYRPYNKKFDLSEPNNAKNFTLAICDKTKFNMFDDGVCEVSSSTPILFT